MRSFLRCSVCGDRRRGVQTCSAESLGARRESFDLAVSLDNWEKWGTTPCRDPDTIVRNWDG